MAIKLAISLVLLLVAGAYAFAGWMQIRKSNQLNQQTNPVSIGLNQPGDSEMIRAVLLLIAGGICLLVALYLAFQ